MQSAFGNQDPETARVGSRGRDWQLILLAVLALGVLLTALSFYGALSAPQTEAGSVLRWIQPLLYGIFTLLVLGSFYLAQREAVFRGLEQELVNQKIEAELNRELALLDPVTEVYNRRYVRVVLKREIGRVQRYGTGLALMMLDITGFRAVNSSLGQAGGDVVLRQVAHLIQNGVRNSDIVVRYGGDEFLVILTDTQSEGAEILAGRLREQLHKWSRSSGLGEFDLTFAIGLAHYSPDRRIDELLGIAEQRMLEDRRPGTPAKPAVRSAGRSAKDGA
jgi:diguanylate cyclase (GGDEF)-like protein